MKSILKNIPIALFIISYLFACSNATSIGVTPEPVHRLIYKQESQEWYEQQAALWKEVVEQDGQNAFAWYNYFMASKYSNFRKKVEIYKGITDGILAEMKNHLPDSYEYNYLMYYNGDRDLKYLEKAYKTDPDRPDALYEFILHYEKNDDKEKLKKYCRELYKTRDITPGLLNYNYNVLASTEKNAILFTNGDNDSYPAWVLQNTFNIRNDVSILNLHLTFIDRDYFERKLSEKGIDLNVHAFADKDMSLFLKDCANALSQKYPENPVYIASTVYSGSTKQIKEQLYLIGLALKYSPERFDNIASIKQNLDNNFRLDYLEYDWYSDLYLFESGLDRLHVNYVVIFIKMAEAYHDSGNLSEARKWKEKARVLAQKADNQKFIKHINELEW
jgi:hypothetical protein